MCLALVVFAAMTVGVKYFEYVQLTVLHNSYAHFYEQPAAQKLAADTVGQPPFRVATPYLDPAENEPSLMWAYGFETPDGYVNLYNRSYNSYWTQVVRPTIEARPAVGLLMSSGLGRVKLWTNWNAAAPASETSVAPRAADKFFDLDLLSLANVRYLMVPAPIKDARLRPVGMEGTLGVYENAEALPRFFLAQGTRSFQTDDQLFEALGSARLSDLSRNVYLVQSAAPPGASPSSDAASPGTVQLGSLSADHERVSVSCAKDCWLVVSQTWSPFWAATVDGTPAPLEPAYGTFQCIRLGRGMHEVSLDYSYLNVVHGSASR